MPRMSLFRRYDETWFLAPGLSISVDQTQLLSEENFPGMALGPSIGREIGGCAEWEIHIDRMADVCYIGVAPEHATNLLTQQAVIANPGEGGRGVQYVEGAIIISSHGKCLRGAEAIETVTASGKRTRDHRPELLGKCEGFRAKDRIGVRLSPEHGLLEFFKNGRPLDARVGIYPGGRWRPCVQMCTRRDAASLRATATFSGLPDPREWELGKDHEKKVEEQIREGEGRRLGIEKMDARQWELPDNFAQLVLGERAKVKEAVDWDDDSDGDEDDGKDTAKSSPTTPGAPGIR